jgi:hypothetical protein
LYPLPGPRGSCRLPAWSNTQKTIWMKSASSIEAGLTSILSAVTLQLHPLGTDCPLQIRGLQRPNPSPILCSKWNAKGAAGLTTKRAEISVNGPRQRNSDLDRRSRRSKITYVKEVVCSRTTLSALSISTFDCRNLINTGAPQHSNLLSLSHRRLLLTTMFQ